MQDLSKISVVLPSLDPDDKLIAVYPIPKQINGYEYEFIECDRLIKEGKLESESMPMDETIFVMSFMDLLRSQWGVVYPQEEE